MMLTVFIPGWSFSADIWQDKNALLWDLPQINPVNLDSAVKNLAQAVPDKAIMIGWSLGGLLAIKFAALFPEKLHKLILIASTPKFMADTDWPGIDAEVANNFLVLAKQNLHALLKHFFSLVNYPNVCLAKRQYLEKYLINSPLAYLDLIFYTDLRNEYRNLEIPTLHILGEFDAICKTAPACLMKLNKNIDLTVIAGAGHAPLVTHAADVFQKIKDFSSDALSHKND